MIDEISMNMDLVDETLQLTDSLVRLYPNRLVGSSDSKGAAEFIKTQLDKFCDESGIEPFEVHPGSFLSFIKWMVLSYLFSIIPVYFSDEIFEIIAFAVMTFALLLGISQFVLYYRLFDFMYRKKTGYNVWGAINPENEVKRQIIIAGHHDSAREFRFLSSKAQYWYAPRILMAVISFITAWLIIMVDLIVYSIDSRHLSWIGNFSYVMIALLVFVLPFYFFLGKNVCPGAGDNLIASIIALKVAQVFHQLRSQGKFAPKNTRLVFLSTDGEEAGLRGAYAFIRKHIDEFRSVPTYVIVIDSIYKLEHLQALTRDINGLVPLDPVLAGEIKATAERLGYRCKLFPFKFFGGATDAGVFARAGIPATCIIAMSTETFRTDLCYHTVNDTVDKIEPAAVQAILKIILNFIIQKDISDD